MVTEAKPIIPTFKWWLVLSGILLCAATLRYTGYNFSLPYIDHPDEPAYNIAGQMIIDNGSAKPIGMHGYPPGIVYLNYFILRWFHNPTNPPGSIIGTIRLISITFSLGVIILIGLLGYQLATPLVGLIAAALWSFSPTTVEFSRYATSDNFVTFFALLTLLLTIIGTHYNRNRLLYASIVTLVFAILFKYQAIFITPIIFVVPLWRLIYPETRTETLKAFGLSLLIFLIFFAWLILLFPSLEATQSPDFSAANSKMTIPSIATIYGNMSTTWNDVRASAIPILTVFNWLGLSVLLQKKQRSKFYLVGVVASILAALAWLVGVSVYGPQMFRQFETFAALLILFEAIGTFGCVLIIEQILHRLVKQLPQKTLTRVAQVAMIGVLIVMTIPNFNASVANAYNHTLPDRRNDLAKWIDQTLPSGSYIATSENHKTFNREWGGYSGQTKFPFFKTASLEQESIQVWRANHVTYAIMPIFGYEELKATSEGQRTLKKIQVLKVYPDSLNYRGPSMVIVRLYPMQYIGSGQLEPIQLVGYDLSASTVTQGDTIRLRLYWKSTKPTDTNYTVFNHIEGANNRLIAQADGPAIMDDRRPTSTWDDPNEVIMSQVYSINIDSNAPIGQFALKTGFYRRDTGERLLDSSGHDAITIVPIVINSQYF
jgi:4-amino-4-deoxy-L-arabinose transferase-like glycosyltransferase